MPGLVFWALKWAVVFGIAISVGWQSVASALVVVIFGGLPGAISVANLGVWFRHATADGRFSFAGLSPGSYVLRAQATKELGAAGGGGLTAELPVTIGDDNDQERTVRLQPSVTIGGKVRPDTLAGADLSKLAVQLVPLIGPSDWEMPVFDGAVDAEGRFSVTNVPYGGRRRVHDPQPAGRRVSPCRSDPA